ncbi:MULTISPECIES: MerR family transcriptional regulator [Brevibacillus]|uniref:MerR family transcriptional regulator n=1 Tax=Brevibacillus TaxID=55080 RepID=UPI000D0FAC5E|nr:MULTISPECIES: MerR family transcriptional regulator [Brevibacillus]MED1943988.1 MerR family transcriptional regulator [Brevibacillus formosus]MED1999640.1 MerR family transcriptional regulator [Brevibacillus formosus]MED2082223.1 MerR family transcriptional regulator [Brevibacillus formosus]PSK18856.1 MerR family transcriptional regulator [Brevibacillus sp. NRRL NRS-603]
MHAKARNRSDTTQNQLNDQTTKDAKFSIGQVAKMTGSSVPTVRYYDEIGLLSPAEITPGGHRMYTAEEIWRLKLILTLRYLNFGIDEIKRMLAGDIPVDMAIEWQIEALDLQMRTLASMKSILEQTKKSKGDSLSYMHELIESIFADALEREKFILEKMFSSVFPEQFPVEWREIVLLGVNVSSLLEGKLSAAQTAALDELEDMFNDPQIVQEMKHDVMSFLEVVHLPKISVEMWTARMLKNHKQLLKAAEQHATPDSPVVQANIQEYVLLFADVDELPVSQSFFRRFAERLLSNQSENLERFRRICSILYPGLQSYMKTNELFYQALLWKLQQMDKE